MTWCIWTISKKKEIPLYSAPTLADGIYLSYPSFFNQTPEHQAALEMQGKKISSVRIKNPDGKAGKFKTKNIYAVVHEGVPYVSIDFE